MSDMTPEQIKAALDAGIITEAQARSMRARQGEPEAVIGNEDDMRFVRSFSDLFVGIGIFLFTLGLGAVASLFGGGVSFLGAAFIMAVMAEYFGRRKRQHLPTLITALGFLAFTQAGLSSVLPDFGISSDIMIALSVFAAMMIFYLRVRLPFCMALIALSLLYVFFALVTQMAPSLMRGQFGWVLVFAGCVIFSVALWYDSQDRHRTTRFADNAFWLHFTAAPLIVHGLVLEFVRLKSDMLFNLIPVPTLDQSDASIMIGIVIVIAVVALAINRRALLVSSLGYAGFAIGFLMTDTGLGMGKVVAFTLSILGMAIIFLGAGWHAVRNRLIKLLPKWGIFPPPFDEDYDPRQQG